MRVEILKNCSLFAGVSADDLRVMLSCLGAAFRRVEKNETVFSEGDRADRIGVVLAGQIRIVQDDYFGRRSILAMLGPAHVFGEAFACAGVERMPVSAEAASAGEVMLLDSARILTVCSHACAFHNTLIRNLLRETAQKNLMLRSRMEIAMRRTTREKLMAYLLSEAKRAGTGSFTIPYDRQALADYLGVERSAMSAEIGRLRREGILETERSFFRILSAPEWACGTEKLC